MSFGGNPALSQGDMIVMETQAMQKLVNTISQNCWQKCVAGVDEKLISDAERTCADICVQKYPRIFQVDTYPEVHIQKTFPKKNAKLMEFSFLPFILCSSNESEF